MRWNGKFSRVDLHGVHTRRDYFDIENITYQAIPLDVNSRKGLGINSCVYRAVRDDGDDVENLIIKVCNFADEFTGEKAVARRDRFGREIKAMQRSLDMGKQTHVVTIKASGKVKVQHEYAERTHQCFLMEPAQQNLGEFLTQEVEISFQQRLLLCAELIRSVRALHDIGVYHRDIKPENILLCDGGWKIGDLGLVGFRGEDSEAESREKIGPPRWMSPEAFNKAYCIQRPTNAFIDRQLDERSDVYQLGKVCWHILQGDIPNGCLKSKDFVEGDENVFGTFLKPMLRYRRDERPSLADVESRLVPLMQRHSN
jgi:serine/threonine protein kinase